MNEKFTPYHHGDYYIFCDICGAKCWASESILLDTYTGRGGLRVCPEDADPIDYGIVPYKIRSEKPVPFSRDTVNSGQNQWNVTEYSPMIYELGITSNTSPALNNMLWLTIDKMIQTFQSYPEGNQSPAVTNNKNAVTIDQCFVMINLMNQIR